MTSQRSQRSLQPPQAAAPEPSTLALQGTDSDAFAALTALLDEHSEWLAIFEVAREAMLLLTPDGRCLRANAAALSLLEAAQATLIGCALTDIVPIELDILDLGRSDAQQGEVTRCAADGECQTLQYTLTLDVLPSLHVLGLDDVTEQRRLAQEVETLRQTLEQRTQALQQDNVALQARNQQLFASHQKYQTLFEILPIGVSVTDADGNLAEVNLASEEILGISREEHEQLTFDAPVWQGIYPDGRPMPASEFPSVRALQEQRVIVGDEMGIVRPDGRISWLSVSAAPIPLADYGVAIAYLDITNQKQTEATLRQTRDQYWQATQAGQVGVWDWNLDTNEIYIDPILKQMLGYADAEIRNHIDDWASHVYGEDVPAVMDAVTAHLEGQTPDYVVEHRMVCKDGSLRWFLARGGAVRSPDGTPHRLRGTDIDITDRKLAELAVQRQVQQERALNDVVQAVRSSLDLETIFARSVASISKFLAVEVSIVQYLPQESCWRHLLVYNQGTQKIDSFETDVPDAGNPFADRLKRLEIVQIDDTDSIHDPVNQELAEQAPGAWLLVPIGVNGQVWGSLTLGKIGTPCPWPEDEIDLARRVADQLAIAIHQSSLHQQLQMANDRYDHVIRSIGEGIWEWDCQTDTLIGSPRFWEILGESADDLITQATQMKVPIAGLMERVHPEDVARLEAVMTQHLETRSPYSTEIRMRHRDGHDVWIRSRGQAVWDAEGTPLKVLGTIEDVSDRKQAELALRQSEAKTRAILTAIPDLLLRIGIDGRYRELVSDPNGLDLFLDGQDPVGQRVSDFVPPDLVARQQHFAEQALETGEMQVYEHWLTTADGMRYEEARVVPSGEDEVLFMVRDITDRKQLEQNLQDSHDKLASILNSSFACIVKFRLYSDGTFAYDYYSPKSEVIFGYTPEELLTHPELWRSRVSPSDLEQAILPAMQAIFAGQTHPTIEYRFHHRDGSIRWIQENATARRDETQDCWIITTVAIDMSQRKQAELALQESEAFRRKITDVAPLAVFIYDLNIGILTYCNPTYEASLGYTLEELQAMGPEFLSTIYHPASRASIEAHDRAILDDRDGRVYDLEYACQRKDGSILITYSRELVLKRNPDGSPAQILGFGLDITDRKRAEQDLWLTRQFLQNILDHLPLAVFAKDANTLQFSLWNPACTQLMGYFPEEALGRTDYDLFPAEQADQCVAHDQRAIASHAIVEVPEELITGPNGEPRIIATKKVAVYDDSGQPQFVIGMAEDITARKTAEFALRQREQEFRALVENAPDCIMRCDRHGRFLYVNPTVARISGISVAEYLEKTPADLGFPESLVTLWQRTLDRVFETCQEQALEYDVPMEMGYSTFHSRIVPELSPDGAVVSVLVIARDITILKAAQNALLYQAEREHTLRLLTQHIRETLNIHEILGTVVTELQRILDADRTLIFKLQTDGAGVVIQEHVRSGYAPLLGTSWKERCFPNSCRNDYRQAKAIMVSDLAQGGWGECLADFLQRTSVQSEMVAPITHPQEDGTVNLWGLLIIHACAEVRRWQPHELELLQQVAEQLAIALQQSELHHQVQEWARTLEDQVQARTTEIQQSLDFEAILKRITDRVRDSLDEGQILETVVQELGQNLGLECCDTGIYNADRTTSTITHEFVRSLTPARGHTFAITDAPHPDVYSRLFAGQVLLFCDRIPCSFRPDNVRLTILACPIRDDQAILGDMWLMKTASQQFSASEVRLVQQVANQCAIALRQARLFKESQAQVTALERLNQLKDDFLSTVSHELRTPMASIKMATELLEIQLKRDHVLPADFPEGETEGAIARYFQILKTEGGREIRLIDDLLDLTRLDAHTEPLTLLPIDLQDWLESLLEPFITRAAVAQQTLTWDVADLPILTTDGSYLQRILSELLNNACKYTPPGETIHLSAHRTIAGVQLVIANSGVEIAPEECDRIFDRFYRIPNSDPWKHGGTGLGLALVKKMVEYLGGTIRCESPQNTTQFVIDLPRETPVSSS